MMPSLFSLWMSQLLMQFMARGYSNIDRKNKVDSEFYSIFGLAENQVFLGSSLIE